MNWRFEPRRNICLLCVALLLILLIILPSCMSDVEKDRAFGYKFWLKHSQRRHGFGGSEIKIEIEIQVNAVVGRERGLSRFSIMATWKPQLLFTSNKAGINARRGWEPAFGNTASLLSLFITIIKASTYFTLHPLNCAINFHLCFIVSSCGVSIKYKHFCGAFILDVNIC